MKPWNDSNLPVGERATALLQELSLEERVAQLGSFWPSRVADEQPADDGQGRDVAPMESEFAKSRQEWADAHRSGLGHLTRNFGTNPVSVPEASGCCVSDRPTWWPPPGSGSLPWRTRSA